MSNRDSSPVLTASGMACLHLHQQAITTFLTSSAKYTLSLRTPPLSSPTRYPSGRLLTFSFRNRCRGADRRLGVNGQRGWLVHPGTFFPLSWFYFTPGNFTGLAPENPPSGIPKTVSPSKMVSLNSKTQKAPRRVKSGD